VKAFSDPIESENAINGRRPRKVGARLYRGMAASAAQSIGRAAEAHKRGSSRVAAAHSAV
jgi:hypothetical protein